MTQRGKSILWGELLGATERGGISVSDLAKRAGLEPAEVQRALDEWQAHGCLARRADGLYAVVMGWRSSPHRSGTFERLVTKGGVGTVVTKREKTG